MTRPNLQLIAMSARSGDDEVAVSTSCGAAVLSEITIWREMSGAS